MLRSLALVSVLVLGACGSDRAGSHQSTSNPPPAAAASPSASAGFMYDAPGSYPPRYASVSEAWPSDLTLNCRLPVFATPAGNGFVIFPGRTFIADPRSAVIPPIEPPQGHYSFGVSYDKAFGRWLPVWRTWVSPDGERYAIAYPETEGIHIYGLASGSETVIGPAHRWDVLAVESEGVYASVRADSGQGAGLWLLPFAGTPKQVTAAGYWLAVGGGAAYGPITLQAFAVNTIMRLDLRTGLSQPWFAGRNAESDVIGFDAAGSPVIQDNFTGPTGAPAKQIWIVPAPGRGYVIANDLPFFFGEPVAADQNGIWFSGQDHVYLFVPGRGTFIASSTGGLIAGECA